MIPQSSNVDVKGKFGASAHFYPERIENNIQLFACMILVALVMAVVFGVVACFLASSSPWLSFSCVVVVISCFAFMAFCIIKRISSPKEETHHNPNSISDEEKAMQAAEEFSKQIQRDRERKEELEILRMKQELAKSGGVPADSDPHPESYVHHSKGNEISEDRDDNSISHD